MRELTSAERLRRALEIREVDRVPIWLLINPIFQSNPWYPDVAQSKSYEQVLTLTRKYTDFFQRHWFGPGVFYSGVANYFPQTRRVQKKDLNIEEKTLQTPLGPLTSHVHRLDGQVVSQKFMFEMEEDLEKALSIPFEPFKPNLSEFEAIRERLGDRGLMMVNFCTPLAVLYFHTNPETFLIWAIDPPPIFVAFLDELADRAYLHLKYLLENNVGPSYFIIGSEFVAPPMLPPRCFRDLVVKYDKRFIELIQEYGMYAIVHHHGLMKELLVDFKTLAPNGVHPVESPPKGDCTLLEAKQAIGEHICLIGNIQYDDLTRGSSEMIQQQVQTAIEYTDGQGFILSPTAGPYQAEISARTASNYEHLIRFGLEYGMKNGRKSG